MRTLTLLELMVEWEHLPHDQFIVVWHRQLQYIIHDEVTEQITVRIWQRGCCNSGIRMHGIEDAIRQSPDMQCEIHDDPMKHYKFDVEQFRCSTCRLPISNHFTLEQCEKIVDQVLS